MATSIIPCDGEGQAWLLTDEEDNPTEPTCPGTFCGLTAKQLKVKVTMRTRNGEKVPNPATVPGHEIEVEGQELKAVVIDGNYKVHTPTCPTLRRDLTKSGEDKPDTVVAANPRDMILQLWADQIAEADIADPDSPTDAELEPYFGATDAHRCVSRLEGFGSSAKAEKNGATKKDAKQMLATRLIEAMAREIDVILDSNLAGTSKDEVEARLILSGMSNAEIRQGVANWVHHFPADRQRWARSGMAIPVRSDWVGFEAEDNGSDNAEDSEEAEDTE